MDPPAAKAKAKAGAGAGIGCVSLVRRGRVRTWFFAVAADACCSRATEAGRTNSGRRAQILVGPKKMASKQQSKAQLVLGFVLLAVFLFLAGGLAVTMWRALSSLDPRVSVSLVTGVVTVLVAVGSVLVSKHFDRQAEVRAHLRDRKTGTHEKMVGIVHDLSFGRKTCDQPPSEQELVRKMAEIVRELMIWGSDDMIQAFHDFRIASLRQAAGTAKALDTLFAVEDLLLAIRKDLGHKNKNITRGKILRLFVNDLPDSLEQERTK